MVDVINVISELPHFSNKLKDLKVGSRFCESKI